MKEFLKSFFGASLFLSTLFAAIICVQTLRADDPGVGIPACAGTACNAGCSDSDPKTNIFGIWYCDCVNTCFSSSFK